jgi:uncharacterized protein (UPF0276 family)
MSLLNVPEAKPIAQGVGIGLRATHYRALLDSKPAVGWLEVHSENYFGEGGYDLHVLHQLRCHYPISLHGVALSLGSADGTRKPHLAKLKRLVEYIEPALVSEHLCWAALGAHHFNDLLPMPYTREALDVMVAHVSEVQDILRRPILIENISSYLRFRASEMPELQFLAELSNRSGCGILLDLNNLFVNSVNHGFDPVAALDALAPETIGEIHLAGHSATAEVLIDDHGCRVAEAVWNLYRVACRRLGPVPTLIEWDTAIPPLDVLLDEAATAERLREAEYV